MASTYPVVSEIWTLFEGTLILQAKRLVEDIAKHQKADPKALWAKIKPQVRIGILDIDLPEPLLTLCSHPSGSCEGGAIALRCRAPCLLGFDACQKHIGMRKQAKPAHELVDRVMDFKGGVYFVDSRAIAHDRNGRPKGYVKDEVLYLFEKEV
jgi:hypothetical protein